MRNYDYKTIYYLFLKRDNRSDGPALQNFLKLGMEEADVLNGPCEIFHGQDPDPDPPLLALALPVSILVRPVCFPVHV